MALFYFYFLFLRIFFALFPLVGRKDTDKLRMMLYYMCVYSVFQPVRNQGIHPFSQMIDRNESNTHGLSDRYICI